MAKRILILFIAALSLASCSEYSKLLRNGTVEEKYAAAIKYYDQKEYFRTTTLMENVIPFLSGSDEFEDALFVFAEAYFYQKEYILSKYYYQKFTDKFPRNPKVQTADYMSAKSMYMMSPKASLDQTETQNAIVAYQTFLNKYPKTTYQTECNAIIDELQGKLEEKAYNSAKLHLKIGNFKAAVKSFELFPKQYPASNYNEEIAYLKIKAQLELAKQSVPKIREDGKIIYLQRNRYQETVDFYFDFIDSYPSSQFGRTAENYYKTALNNTKIK